MGLDMYLYRVPKGSEVYKSEEEIAALPEESKVFVLPKEGEPWNGSPSQPKHEYYHAEGVEEVGYWRKANAIHGWFVNECGGGVDECQPIPVHPEQIIDLRSRCHQVLDDHGTAMTLLPPMRGFFFGTYDLDEWYFKDLEETIKIIDELAATAKPGYELIYQASW